MLFVYFGWGAHRGVGMSPLVFWEICDFPKHVQNIDNVLPYNRATDCTIRDV